MPNYCSVNNCYSYSKDKKCKNLKFFCFPKDKTISAIWVKACGNKNVNVKYGRICALHFGEEDYCLKHRLLNEPLHKRRLNPKATPTKNLPESCGRSALSVSRALRADKRNNKKIVASCIENYEKSNEKDMGNTSTNGQENIPQVAEVENSIATQTDNEKDMGNTSTNGQENIPQFAEVKNSIATQTEVDLESSRDFRIMELEIQLQLCQQEKKQLEENCKKLRSLERYVKAIFTEEQIKRPKNPKKKLK